MSLKERRRRAINQQIKPIVPVVRSWFLEEGLRYMKERKMTNLEEEALERMSEFYLTSLEHIEAGVLEC